MKSICGRRLDCLGVNIILHSAPFRFESTPISRGGTTHIFISSGSFVLHPLDTIDRTIGMIQRPNHVCMAHIHLPFHDHYGGAHPYSPSRTEIDAFWRGETTHIFSSKGSIDFFQANDFGSGGFCRLVFLAKWFGRSFVAADARRGSGPILAHIAIEFIARPMWSICTVFFLCPHNNIGPCAETANRQHQ